MTLKEYFTGIADTVRTKNGSTGKIQATDIPSKIRSLVLNTDVKSASGDLNGYAEDHRTHEQLGGFGASVERVEVDNSGAVVITMGADIWADGQGSKNGTIDIPIEY